MTDQSPICLCGVDVPAGCGTASSLWYWHSRRLRTAVAGGVIPISGGLTDALRARVAGPAGDISPGALAAPTVADGATGLHVLGGAATAVGLDDRSAHFDRFYAWLFGCLGGRCVGFFGELGGCPSVF